MDDIESHLIVSRKESEAVTIGDSVRMVVEKIKGNRVKLSFFAPRDCKIMREEICLQGKDGK